MVSSSLKLLSLAQNDFHQYFKELAKLDSLYMNYPWKEDDWQQLYGNFPNSKLFLYLLGSSLEGFALYFLSEVEEQAHLIKIVTTPEVRGTGAARDLFRFSLGEMRSLNKLRNIYLEVETKNYAAISFYRKLSFETLIEKKKFYSDGADAYAMQLQLD